MFLCIYLYSLHLSIACYLILFDCCCCNTTSFPIVGRILSCVVFSEDRNGKCTVFGSAGKYIAEMSQL